MPSFPNNIDALSEIKDPFLKDKIICLLINVSKGIFSPYAWRFSASVEFKNGDTEGKQNFNASSFDELIVKVKAFLETMK